MRNSQADKVLLLAMPIAAFWPVWQWYAARVMDSSNDSWELLGLATAAVFLFQQKPNPSPAGVRLGLPILLLLIYAAACQSLPPLLRAAIAISAVAATLSAICYGRHLHMALWGLLLLSLPIIASLNFYLGYPLRVMVGSATAFLLQLNGLAVIREGTLLNWNGQLISIDAPCSGVKMLWAGLYLAFTLAAFHRLDGIRTALLGLLAMAMLLSANVLRAAALFYVESDLVKLPGKWHAGIGIVAFLLAALVIAGASRRAKRLDLAA